LSSEENFSAENNALYSDIVPVMSCAESSYSNSLSDLTRIGLKCLYFNACSLLSKFAELHYELYSSNYDIVLITETWLTPDILDHELDPRHCYTVYRCDRPSRGGGACLLVRTSVQSVRLPQPVSIMA